MSMNRPKEGCTTARQPDLDWSQVRETVRMLQLAVAQIDISLREGDDSVKTLSGSFTSMIESVERIRQAHRQLACAQENSELIRLVEREGEEVTQRMRESIVAFQFYDKLSQRLSHVSHALASLAELVGDPARLYSPSEWQGLQVGIRSRYSIREEQEMFDLLLSGASVEEALARGMELMHKPDGEEIELF